MSLACIGITFTAFILNSCQQNLYNAIFLVLIINIVGLVVCLVLSHVNQQIKLMDLLATMDHQDRDHQDGGFLFFSFIYRCDSLEVPTLSSMSLSL